MDEGTPVIDTAFPGLRLMRRECDECIAVKENSVMERFDPVMIEFDCVQSQCLGCNFWMRSLDVILFFNALLLLHR